MADIIHTTNPCVLGDAQANRAQSVGNEPPGPGLMSFHNVTLPSAPNLYSSVPVSVLVPPSHAAFSKMDEGVESGSPAAWLTSCGLKPPGTAVHWVTLPSAPSLNSCCPPTPVLPLNHSALANSNMFCGFKPPPPVLRAVHFVTLPSNPNLYS